MVHTMIDVRYRGNLRKSAIEANTEKLGFNNATPINIDDLAIECCPGRIGSNDRIGKACQQMIFQLHSILLNLNYYYD